ncbi:hypothetical protein P3X46_018639 [Hevea brasiliensis]|uniref:Protein PHLOEM PROTEIN 2-LIKE A10 n=1 Tax=Hevea brasiliensis TaxID=3981 RepID=A0ABQ9LSK4_HEVBR|nr:hypothetical protein P3X46_018639 [Hevea brasiliensis]
MDLQLVEKGLLGYTWKRKRLVAMLAAIVFSTYAAYRVYHLPSIEKRKRFSKVLGALIFIAEVIYDSAETVGIISKDLKDFLQSEFDQIPNSLKQISKVASLTQALTLGILRGYQYSARIDHDSSANVNPSFLDKVFDKLSTPVGSGFVSVFVGSFARNLIMAFYQDETSCCRGLNSNSDLNGATATTSNHVCSEMNSVRELVDVVCSHKCKELISDCIQLFVSSAVAVYLEKTMHINTYDEILAGLTNPKPENETSYQVLTSADSEANSKQEFPNLRIDQEEDSPENEEHKSKPKTRMSFDEVEDGGWVRKGSSTLAITSNRRIVLGVTGRITFEMVRSFLDFLTERLLEGIKRCVYVVHGAVFESSLGVVRYITAKSSVIATICLSLYLHMLDSTWILVPA